MLGTYVVIHSLSLSSGQVRTKPGLDTGSQHFQYGGLALWVQRVIGIGIIPKVDLGYKRQ